MDNHSAQFLPEAAATPPDYEENGRIR